MCFYVNLCILAKTRINAGFDTLVEPFLIMQTEVHMEIRKLKPEENVHRHLMSSICFSGDVGPEDRYAWLNNPEDHTHGYEDVWGAFDESGRLLSCMVLQEAHIRINGPPVKAGLVGGVTTLPEARNARCVRKIYEVIMPLMAKEGYVYSMLYPFSFPFYRKFGYEHGLTKQRASFPTSELSKYPYPDGVKVHDKGGPWADFAAVYNAFAKDKNIAMVRGEKEWEGILSRDPHQNREFTYIHYNPAGQPDGYILYSNNKDEHTIMDIKELAWTNKEGLYAMLGFIHGLRSEYYDVSWIVPEGLDIFSIVESSWDVKFHVDSILMTRVMDVTKALLLLDAPAGENSVTIGVRDKFLPFNTGAYSISWKNGKLKVEKTEQPPDMEMDVETLSQLTTGYLTPYEAQYRQDVTIHGKLAELISLFPRKNLYFMESF